jgi:uncharacterized BrkB/YihY/UPF0761 family membrane protein
MPLRVKSYMMAVTLNKLYGIALYLQHALFSIGSSIISWLIGSSDLNKPSGAAASIVVFYLWINYSLIDLIL